MKTLGFRQARRLGAVIKILMFGAFLLISCNFYLTWRSSEIFKSFSTKNMTVGEIQAKLADFVQRGQIFNSNDDGMSEKEKAKLLGLDDGITDEMREIMKELNITDAGEWGAPIVYPAVISDKIRTLNQTLYDTYGYNAFVSKMISLNRALPDIRVEYCKTMKYPYDLPKASVIIQFHDDDWTLLMRTVHTILLRTPDRLLEEIVLVYDLSDREYFGEKLDQDLKKYPKVRLIRSHDRLGITPSRILGARNAIGPVLIYMDSHSEVLPGWIEPLLARIKEKPNTIVWPKLPGIAGETMRVYLDNSTGALGEFNWGMGFHWMGVGWYEGDHPLPEYGPHPSVTLPGGAFAVRKDFFHKIGLLDTDFDIWGGEDVELSFRTWMCGGRIELVPCSVIAHVYKSHTYKMQTEGKGGARYNTDRIAEVWLDEYKRYYYRVAGDTKDRYFGDISARLELKKKLGCKPFKWFIENIHPKIDIPAEISDEVWERKIKEEEEKKRQEEEEKKKKEEEENERKRKEEEQKVLEKKKEQEEIKKEEQQENPEIKKEEQQENPEIKKEEQQENPEIKKEEQ